MAINISEMQIQMQETPAPPAAAPSQPVPDTRHEVQANLELLRERMLRLKAD